MNSRGVYNEGGELDQVKVLYSASQRRVQELTVENENLKAEMSSRTQDLKHQVEMRQDQVEELEIKVGFYMLNMNQQVQHIISALEMIPSWYYQQFIQCSLKLDTVEPIIKLQQIRSELEQSEKRAFTLDKKLTSYENANKNLAHQNADFEKRQLIQIAEIESLENELRIANSEDVIQKANAANRRKLEESRAQHKEETDRLKVKYVI